MVVLLIGRVGGHELELLRAALASEGGEGVVVNVDQWPGEEPLTLDASAGYVQAGSDRFALDEVEGVFARMKNIFVPAIEEKVMNRVSDDDNQYAALTQLREYRGLFYSIIQTLDDHGATVVPGVESILWESMNPHACRKFDSLGLDVPETLATVDADAAREFVQRHGTVVYKSIAGIGGAHLMSADEADRLDGLVTPVMFQELVPGEDVRVFVLDGEYLGAFRYAFEGDEFTFKDAENDVTAEGIELPEPVQEDVVRAVEGTPMNYATVDLRQREDGSFALLEANAGGRFMVSDSEGITNVSDALATYLLQ